MQSEMTLSEYAAKVTLEHNEKVLKQALKINPPRARIEFYLTKLYPCKFRVVDIKRALNVDEDQVYAVIKKLRLYRVSYGWYFNRSMES